MVRAGSPDPEAEAWRAEGYPGLTRALEWHDTLTGSGASAERLTEAARVVDAVAGQCDATFSRLYWHTDLEAAKAQAEREGKPILALRMLGKLTDEYSCANSRYFRTVLYANEEVSEVLRERWVLVWTSERPVPRITIDFGDGRKLERTVTGNSAHYVLDAEGRPVDMLPGLYGPAAFLRLLETARPVAVAMAGKSDSERIDLLREHHQQQATRLRSQWKRASGFVERARQIAGKDETVAMAAQRLAQGKAVVEIPLVAEIAPERADDTMWQILAGTSFHSAQLDANSRALMRSKIIAADGEQDPDGAMAEKLRRFEEAVALDTVRNEHLLHRKVHEWFAAGEPVTAAFEPLNERVYAELFLTPRSDPWLGLAPADAYTALPSEGLVQIPKGER